MSLRKKTQPVPERTLAHLLSQQMQDVSSLVVYKHAVFTRWVKPIRKHERLVFSSRSHFLIVRVVLLDRAHVSRASETMLDIRRSDECRDSFVEPEMIPVPTSHHVAPPLMRKLVRTKPKVLFVFQHLLSVRFGQSRETAHLLLDPARRQHLRVSSIGILNTCMSLEKVEHIGRIAKNAAHFTLVIVCREVLQLDVASFLLDDVKWTSRKSEDVSRNG